MYQYPLTIFEAIRQERRDFLDTHIEIVDGMTFNQYETIKKIHKYLNGHYVDGDYETINDVTRKKVFWKIGTRQATIATKQLDIDFKDFLLISENPETEWNVFLLEKELKAWMKKGKWSKVLNQVADELPQYGSVVLRKTKDGAELLDLRHLFNDQTANSLQNARYINIKHLMSPDDLRKMVGKWDHVEDVIDRYCAHSIKSYEDSTQNLNKQVGSPLAEVWERIAISPVSYLENEGRVVGNSKADDEYVLTRFFVAGIDDQKRNDQGIAYDENGLVLFKEELDEIPLKEVYYKKTSGRWLGVGVIEETFEEQRMVNKTKDQEDKAAELASLILFQTADELVQRNLLADVDNGEVLKSKNGITRLDNKLDLSQFKVIADDYEIHADKLNFSSDLLGGELPPASATATAVVNQLQQATSVYDYKKENIALFFEEFISDLVFPDLKRKLNSQHTFRFAGSPEELNKIREKAFNYYAKLALLSGAQLDEIQLAQEKEAFIKGMQEQGARVWVDVEKEFFKDIDYHVSLEITGEGKNVQTQLQNLQFVMSLVGQNPGILEQNPLLKRLLTKVMSLMGMSETELENASVEQQEMAEQQQQQQMQQMMMEAQLKNQATQLPTEQPQLASLV
jgi:hypothetical protein